MSGKKLAIILMGHGSRVPEAGSDMERLAGHLRQENMYDIVETCHMSRFGPHLPETMEKCVKDGAEKIILIPYFLNHGLHVVLDIPELMKREAEKYPGVAIVLGKYLGFDNLLVDLVKKRIEQSKDLQDVRDLKLASKEQYPPPPGQGEFIELPPDDAKKFSGHHHH